jgi:hypothetical protein
MLDMLPENEQNLAYEVMQRLVLAWDSDFTKATPAETASMKKSMAEYERGEVVKFDDIDWEAEPVQ